MGDDVVHVEGIHEQLARGLKFGVPPFRFIGLGHDVDVPAGKLGGQPDVLAPAADGEALLIVGDHHFDAVGVLVEHHLGHLGRGQGVDDEGGGIRGPLDDVDLFALQLADDGLHPGPPHADARANGVDARIVGQDGDLGARSRVPGHGLDFYDAVVDFRHLLGEQLGHELGMGPGQEDLRAARLLAHVDDVGAHPVAGVEVLAGDGFVAAEQPFRPVHVDDHVAVFDPFHQAVDHLADAVLEFLVVSLAFGFPHLLDDHLLGRLRRDAAEVDGRQGVDQEVAELRVRLALAGRLQVHLGDLAFHLVGDLQVAGEGDFPRLAVDEGADVVLVAVFGAPRLLDGLFHGLQDLVLVYALVAGDGFRHLQQLRPGVNGVGRGFTHAFSPHAASRSSVRTSFARWMSGYGRSRVAPSTMILTLPS